jgi:flagellar biosynthetic protein FliO
MSGIGVQSLAGVSIVLALVVALAWLARRGTFAALRRTGPVMVETAVPLGERRSLIIVAVEGRRLLLGLTPSSVSMVAELSAVAAVPAPAPTFDSHLESKS